MRHFARLLALGGLGLLAGPARGQAVTFASPATFSAGASAKPEGLAAADVNGDGRPDLLVANPLGNSVSVLLNVGGGSFGPATTFGTGKLSRMVAAADVSGDGRPDLLTADGGSNTVSVLLGGGGGSFGPAISFGAGGSGTQAVAVADVNGDGRPDLLTANASGTVGVLLGLGAGSFGPATAFGAGAGSQPWDVAVADVNGDGRSDLLTANSYGNTVSVLPGTGTGSFGPAATFAVGAGNSPFGIAVADVNGDGRPDLATANFGSGTASVLPGTGAGSFGAATAFSAGGGYTLDIALADVNGDGRPDLLTANAFTAAVGMLLGTGTGSFAPVVTVGTGGSYTSSVAVADVNGDGRPDLLAADSNGTVAVLLNTTPLPTRAALPGATASLAPNPAGAGTTTLTLGGLPAAVTGVQATVLDVTGRPVARHALAVVAGAARAELPTAGLAPGLYVLRLAARDAPGQPAGELPALRLSVE